MLGKLIDWPVLGSRRLLELCIFSILFGLPCIRAEDPGESSPGESSQSAGTVILARVLDAVQLKDPDFRWEGELAISIDGKPQSLRFSFDRFSDSDFDLQIEHSEYAVQLIRRSHLTVMALPKHGRVFWGAGETDAADHLSTSDLLSRLIRPTTSIAVPFSLLTKLDVESLMEVLKSSGTLRGTSTPDRWTLSDDVAISFVNDIKGAGPSMGRMEIESSVVRGHIDFTTETTNRFERPDTLTIDDWLRKHWGDWELQTIPRAELEKTLVRGGRRALEVLAPSERLSKPAEKVRTAEHGELRWIDGHRVAILHGTPEQIGAAHATLLKNEAMRCVDSVLYGFGFVQTISNGRWFREDLDRAYDKLRSHIPERHLAETRALARGLGMDEHLVEVLNVFPELFHCSGFAVFGSATQGGKLYHGRVLDYMTTIGLQDAATTFVVAPIGQIPFVNIGYAGFTGSVSGMNAQRVSLGEMGGRGEGKWDGVPMATLMRRALEECNTLEDVKHLWRSSPRTCEYFYVFADGKNKSAVGVAATPEGVEFLEPGQSHPLLGEGQRDTVLMSAGSRLEELRRRVSEAHGKIDEKQSMELMCRPVAMDSNLHNVLFVPEDGVLFVANASHSQPAADRPYVRLDFLELIKSVPTEDHQASSEGVHWKARDTLLVEIDRESSDDARACLKDLSWNNSSFDVLLENANESLASQGCDGVVRFESPIDTGDPINDLVAMEWYRAEAGGEPIVDRDCPAMVVVHESGRGMTVGRMIARGLSKQGVHALMLQLPTYGLRRSGSDSVVSGENLILAMKQGIVDARRAYDAARVLPGVDPDRVGLQGTSLGGFVVATVSGLDSAYHRSIILLAGGDLYSVLKNGDRDASKTRNELAKRGLTLESIRDILHTIEPLRLAHRVASSKTWLYSGTQDTVVPPASSKAFVEAAKLPAGQHIEMPADHYSGVVFLPGVIRQMSEIVSER